MTQAMSPSGATKEAPLTRALDELSTEVQKCVELVGNLGGRLVPLRRVEAEVDKEKAIPPRQSTAPLVQAIQGYTDTLTANNVIIQRFLRELEV